MISIEQDGVRRALADKPFNLCVDGPALDMLLLHLQAAKDRDHQFGVIPIYEPVRSDLDQDPEPWTAP